MEVSPGKKRKIGETNESGESREERLQDAIRLLFFSLSSFPIDDLLQRGRSSNSGGDFLDKMKGIFFKNSEEEIVEKMKELRALLFMYAKSENELKIPIGSAIVVSDKASLPSVIPSVAEWTKDEEKGKEKEKEKEKESEKEEGKSKEILLILVPPPPPPPPFIPGAFGLNDIKIKPQNPNPNPIQTPNRVVLIPRKSTHSNENEGAIFQGEGKELDEKRIKTPIQKKVHQLSNSNSNSNSPISSPLTTPKRFALISLDQNTQGQGQGTLSVNQLINAGSTSALKKTKLDRSPGGTPKKKRNNDSGDLLAIALKKKFESVMGSPTSLKSVSSPQTPKSYPPMFPQDVENSMFD